MGIEAERPLLAVKGANPDVLVVAFTGFAGRYMMRAYDFLDLMGALGYSYILLRDPRRAWYLHGLGGEARDFPSLVRLLHRHIARLAPSRVITVGTSAGGFAALLGGHLLGADCVHALAPQTYLDIPNIVRHRDVDLVRVMWRALLGVYRVSGLGSRLLDARRLLSEDNGRTRYFLHVCTGSATDRKRAGHLADLARVSVLQHPGPDHNVVRAMVRNGFIHQFLRWDLQDQLEARHAQGVEAPRPGDLVAAPGDRRATIVTLVRRAALRVVEERAIEESHDLQADLGLSSLACLEILVGLENELGLRIDPATVSIRDFRSIASLEALVRRSPSR
jgi:acyl carrier protein